jgi:hypothetical protein
LQEHSILQKKDEDGMKKYWHRHFNLQDHDDGSPIDIIFFPSLALMAASNAACILLLDGGGGVVDFDTRFVIVDDVLSAIRLHA